MPEKKRIVFFAHFDKDNVIDDYVIYYLNGLKEVAKKIIFVSDCDLSAEEKNKLLNIADFIITEPHGEYDFGSYKRGFLLAQENGLLNDFDECIFANDSCYGPFNSLKPIFEDMAQKNCDFWGMTQNKYSLIKHNETYLTYKKPHLQSYFLVFKKNVFLSEVFIDFIKSIKKEENKYEVIINYEIGLCEKLSGMNFKWKSYIEAYSDMNVANLYKWDKLIIDHNMPFLKCSLPRLKHQRSIITEGYEQTIEMVSQYPIELIHKNTARTGFDKSFQMPLPLPIKRILFKIIYIAKRLVKNLCYLSAQVFH